MQVSLCSHFKLRHPRLFFLPLFSLSLPHSEPHLYYTSLHNTTTSIMSVYYQALMPTPLHGVESPTSDEQVEAENSISALLHTYQKAGLTASPASSKSSSKSGLPSANSMPVPPLDKAHHLSFLRKVLEPLPSSYVGFDTTRCWLIFWVAHSYYLMGTELPEPLRSRAISTLLHFQDNEVGGFGSGQGQFGHLMASYATVMALAILGGPGPCPDENDIKLGQSVQVGKGGWDDIDRWVPGM